MSASQEPEVARVEQERINRIQAQVNEAASKGPLGPLGVDSQFLLGVLSRLRSDLEEARRNYDASLKLRDVATQDLIDLRTERDEARAERDALRAAAEKARDVLIIPDEDSFLRISWALVYLRGALTPAPKDSGEKKEGNDA